MEHNSEADAAGVVVCTLAFAENARLNVALTFARAEKNVSAAASLYHSLCNEKVLVFVAVVLEFGAVRVKFKMRLDLITGFS